MTIKRINPLAAPRGN